MSVAVNWTQAIGDIYENWSLDKFMFWIRNYLPPASWSVCKKSAEGLYFSII